MPVSDKFTMPAGLVVDESTATERYAKLTAEPWEKGFGHTLGNALRRVLLSSLDGVAVAAIRIDGVPHEFTSIPDVVEDVTEIVLNVKQLRLSCEGDLPRTLELYAEKAGPVTAACVREDGVTSVLNPDLLICTLDKDRPFRMELEITGGRGYRASEDNKREDHAIGTVPVDSLFSPVERVRYDIRDCRVGQRTDYDSILLEVWTDGRIDPKEAVRKAALLLREHLTVFIEEEDEASTVYLASAEERELLDKLCMSVNEMELSVRAKNCLNNAQVRVVGQLVTKMESEMLKYRNFGKKSLDEIKAKLIEMGLGLGMSLKDEVRMALDERLAAENRD